MCTRVGVLARRAADSSGATRHAAAANRVWLHSGRRTSDRCGDLLGATVASVTGDRLLVRADDPASLNAYLVGEGVRVDEIGPYRRTLEQVVLEAEARA